MIGASNRPVMTLELVWEVLSLGLGVAGASAQAFPLPPLQVMENSFLFTLPLSRNKPDLSPMQLYKISRKILQDFTCKERL